MKQGTRVIIVDVGQHELTEKQRKGKIAGVHGRGYKVEIDGYGGGMLYFNASQLEEVKK